MLIKKHSGSLDLIKLLLPIVDASVRACDLEMTVALNQTVLFVDN